MGFGTLLRFVLVEGGLGLFSGQIFDTCSSNFVSLRHVSTRLDILFFLVEFISSLSMKLFKMNRVRWSTLEGTRQAYIVPSDDHKTYSGPSSASIHDSIF